MTQAAFSFLGPDRVPIARKSDPKTSHEAARAITASGRRDEQVGQVLQLVVAHPGCTSRELTEYTKLDRYAIARRLPELEAEHKVYKGVPRACALGHRNAVTWWPGKPTQ